MRGRRIVVWELLLLVGVVASCAPEGVLVHYDRGDEFVEPGDNDKCVPKPEVCNGLDEDCDGEIDEGLTGKACGSLPAEEWWRYTNGTCRPGVTLCTNGRWECAAAVEPQPEDCTPVDRDCDGEPRNGLELREVPVDYVVIVDISGSNIRYLNCILSVLNTFAETHTADRFHYHRVNVGMNTIPGYERTHTGLNSIEFQDSLTEIISSTGTVEPTLDALDDLAQPTNPLGIAWQEDSLRVVLLFADEEPQSRTTTRTAQSVGMNLGFWGLIDQVVMWVELEQEYAPIIDNQNGYTVRLVSDCEKVEQGLDDVASMRCVD